MQAVTEKLLMPVRELDVIRLHFLSDGYPGYMAMDNQLAKHPTLMDVPVAQSYPVP